MATSQRLSRGFHRLAIFFAAILLLAGSTISYFFARDIADGALLNHEKTVCAHRHVASKEPDDTPGLNQCQSMASGYAIEKKVVDADWGYICCMIAHGSDCYEKHK